MVRGTNRPIDRTLDCSWSWCTRKRESALYCGAHYARSRRGQDMDRPIERRLSGTPIERFSSNVDTDGPVPMHDPSLGPCHVWTAYCQPSNGYGRFDSRTAHKWIYEHHHGVVPDGMWVLHRCDNPPCVRIDHLYAGTPKQNQRDIRDRTGAYTNTTLTAWDVRDIREMYANGCCTHQQIADGYGVSKHCITQVILRKTWAWVEPVGVAA